MARFTLPARLVVIWWPSGDEPATLGSPSLATDIGNVNAENLIGSSQGEGLAEMNGWVTNPTVFETPDYVSSTVSNVPGDTTIPESSIGFWMDDTDRTIYDALAPGSVGAIGIFFDGTGVGEESNLYTCTIQNRRREFDRGAGHKVLVDFALAVPVVGAVVA